MSAERDEDGAARALEEGLVAFLCEECRVGPDEIGRDTQLVSSGLLDSMGMVRLATHLERAAGIEIPDDDIQPETFESITKILDYVRAKRGG